MYSIALRLPSLYPSEQKALIATIYMAASVSCWQDTAPRRGIKGQEWTLSPPFCTSPNKHKINLSSSAQQKPSFANTLCAILCSNFPACTGLRAVCMCVLGGGVGGGVTLIFSDAHLMLFSPSNPRWSFSFYLNAHRLSSGEEQQQMQCMSNHQHNWVRFKKKKKIENMLPFFSKLLCE